MEANLTEKQKRFCEEYLVDLNATQAYIRAGYAIKKKITAEQNGSKLLKITKVVNYIEQLKNERTERTLIKADKVLEELAHIAFDDIKNYLDFRTEKTVICYDDEEKPIFKHDIIVDLKDSRSIDTRNISEVSIGKDGQFKFKLYCKDNALVKLGEHLGIFKNEVDITGKLNLVFDDDYGE